jgi:tellurite resistance protein
MGVVGLGLSWRFAATLYRVTSWPGEILIAVGSAMFIVLSFRYFSKAVRYPSLVLAELEDRSDAIYFSAIAISFSLVAMGAEPYSRPLAFGLLSVGALASVVLVVLRFESWISRPADISTVTPAWFIPAVGNATAAVAAAQLGLFELGWFLLSVGLCGWFILHPIVFGRLFAIERMPSRYTPSLAVLASSPALFAGAWFALNGGHNDAIFRLFVFAALFYAVIAVRLILIIGVGTAFTPGWWGFTFPAAAVTGALLRYSSLINSQPVRASAGTLLIAATLLTAYVAVRQLSAGRNDRRKIDDTPVYPQLV